MIHTNNCIHTRIHVHNIIVFTFKMFIINLHLQTFAGSCQSTIR